jgi:4-alpha-glucanotransferase
MTGGDRELQRAARAAGLHTTWTDNDGRERTVSTESLRSLLDALSASGDGDTNDAGARLHVGTAGRSLRVPAKAGARWRLSPDPDHGFLAGADADPETGSDARVALEGVFADSHEDGSCTLRLPEAPGYYLLEAQQQTLRIAVAPPRCPDIAGRRREGATGLPWGIAAQLYGLRGEGGGDTGIGDFGLLGTLAEHAARAGADALAISPTHALFAARPRHYSPYSPSSRLALNALYADPGEPFGAAALREAAFAIDAPSPSPDGLVDWPAVARHRNALMDALFDAMPDRHPEARQAFESWAAACPAALRDHALFEALHGDVAIAGNDAAGWRAWPSDWHDPDGAKARGYAQENARSVQRHLFRQWLACRGLAQARQRARDSGMSVGLIADLAVGTDPDGSHVWSRREDFLVGPTIGAPPDALGPDGQNWGLAAFSPRALQASGYRAFIELLRANLVQGGGLRIDHVMGLMRLWMIPKGGGADDGVYLSYPLDELLALLALEAFRHDCIVIGEDLGTVPPGFRDNLSARGILGMGVLLFERDDAGFLPLQRWRRDAVAYTTTHDLPTLAGWWTGADARLRRALGLSDESREAEALSQRRRERGELAEAIRAEGGACIDDEDASADAFVDAAIEHVGRSPAPLAILPLEDATATREQPNLPGTVDEHPNWRRRMSLPVTRIFDDEGVRERLARHRAARANPRLAQGSTT